MSASRVAPVPASVAVTFAAVTNAQALRKSELAKAQQNGSDEAKPHLRPPHLVGQLTLYDLGTTNFIGNFLYYISDMKSSPDRLDKSNGK